MHPALFVPKVLDDDGFKTGQFVLGPFIHCFHLPHPSPTFIP